MNRFLSLAEAAEVFGYSTGTALRKAFERGIVPTEYLLRVGARGLRVDAARLETWLRGQLAYAPQKAKSESANKNN